MVFIRKILVLLYLIAMVTVGASIIALSLGLLTPEMVTDVASLIKGDINYQVGAASVGAIFVVIGIMAPYRLSKKIRKNRIVSFQNADGEVTVSLAAIEDYILKVTRNVPDIKEVGARVDINRKGIDIIMSVSMASAANIPDITERVQMAVKSSVKNMLGIEEKINIKMHVKKIMKAERAAEPLESGEPEIPYRESR
ncbi:MAG: alkaline shock response membrane anchor protein AmaP [Candidatus Omnitrophica bacterium]|nr:alkaline shock response membrane anchor protein AmaP [Candidatus Omnitrophota bacterium]MDD5487343.1 alkaline shock response membrane anchor protein AmaP [Candidatus Omnitrophota bacterium]